MSAQSKLEPVAWRNRYLRMSDGQPITGWAYGEAAPDPSEPERWEIEPLVSGPEAAAHIERLEAEVEEARQHILDQFNRASVVEDENRAVVAAIGTVRFM